MRSIGVVPWSLCFIPNAAALRMELFYFEKNHRVFDSFWATAKRMPARRGQLYISTINHARRGALLLLAPKSNTKDANYSIYILLLMEDIQWL